MSCHCIGDLISRKCPEHRSIYKWQEAYEKDQKEIERLEAELEQTEREAQCAASNADKYHNIIREQRAENERLREALQKIAELRQGRPWSPAFDIADDALKGGDDALQCSKEVDYTHYSLDEGM